MTEADALGHSVGLGRRGRCEHDSHAAETSSWPPGVAYQPCNRRRIPVSYVENGHANGYPSVRAVPRKDSPMGAKIVKNAAGERVAAITCSKCQRRRAPCPCGYRVQQCKDCCPGEPPSGVYGKALTAWNAARGQQSAARAARAVSGKAECPCRRCKQAARTS